MGAGVPQSERAGRVPLVLSVIAALLLVLVLLNAFFLVRMELRATEAAQIAKSQRELIDQMETNYKDAVYHDPEIKGAPQQQFRATEMTFEMLRLIATQNSQRIELLSSQP